MEEKKKTESKEKEQKKEKEAEEKMELEKNVEAAKNTIKRLEERIKQMDEINRELSTKLETLESRSSTRRYAAWLGGFLILFGGIVITSGLFLALAEDSLAFIYDLDQFPAAFSYLMIFFGGLLVSSGFLHQV